MHSLNSFIEFCNFCDIQKNIEVSLNVAYIPMIILHATSHLQVCSNVNSGGYSNQL